MPDGIELTILKKNRIRKEVCKKQSNCKKEMFFHLCVNETKGMSCFYEKDMFFFRGYYKKRRNREGFNMFFLRGYYKKRRNREGFNFNCK